MSENMELVVALMAITFITIVNIFGVKISELFANVFTGAKLLGIGAVIIAGIVWGSITVEDIQAVEYPMPENMLTAFGLALVGVLWSYGGWQHASYLSGEARNAQRTIPLAMIIGSITVALVYLATNASYLFIAR